MFGAGGWPMSGGLFGMFWTALLLVCFVYIITRLFKNSGQRPGVHSDREDSLNIIREKYARGEISSDEYQRMKDILST